MEEFLKSLGANSPWLALTAGSFIWFMKTVVQPLTARHLKWMDDAEDRDVKKTELLAKLDGNLTELRQMQKEHIEICRTGMNHAKVVHPKPV